jgi:propionyl-CoA synthetase
MASESRYTAQYASWIADPDGFWLEQAKAIDWMTPPARAFDANAGVYGHWFPDAECNTAFNALDRHVNAGRGEKTALIYDSPVTGQKQRFSYQNLRDETATLAAVLLEQGVQKGDRVIIYMPMVPEAVIGMLACARIGAVHSVVFGGFAPRELATRIDDATPKLILSASCGIEPGRVIAYKPLLDEAVALANHKPDRCIVLQREALAATLDKPQDRDWQALVTDAKARGASAAPVTVKATDPLYILYTSGTTGQPKGVVRDNGGHMVALHWTMGAIYDIGQDDVWFAASDIGWVVGHSYIVYAPLLKGCTAILYEGKPVGTPDAGAYWRLIAEHGVKAMFTAPTAFRAIKRDDPDGKYLAGHDLSRFQTLFLAGERADPDTVQWAERLLDRPVIDHWWQTETGWSICANPAGLGFMPKKYGTPGVMMPGYDLRVLDEANSEVATGTMASIALKLPLPPGSMPTLWNADQRFYDAYLADHPGYYKTADAGYVDADGYVYVMGRTDDIINVAGHRLSTGGMEEVIASHPNVAECAVIGIRDELKGEIPLGFIVMKAGVNRDGREIEREVVQLVRDSIGAVAAFKRAVTVLRLPKTRSGKILRGTMKKIADGDSFSTPATIDDPAILTEIAEALNRGFTKLS